MIELKESRKNIKTLNCEGLYKMIERNNHFTEEQFEQIKENNNIKNVCFCYTDGDKVIYELSIVNDDMNIYKDGIEIIIHID